MLQTLKQKNIRNPVEYFAVDERLPSRDEINVVSKLFSLEEQIHFLEMWKKILLSNELRPPALITCVFEPIRLHFIYDSVTRMGENLNFEDVIDAWFLDGFSPAKNPEMWTEVVYRFMARHSRTGTTFSTYSSAGNVLRDLTHVGFAVEKVKGFGKKRTMLRGVYR